MGQSGSLRAGTMGLRKDCEEILSGGVSREEVHDVPTSAIQRAVIGWKLYILRGSKKISRAEWCWYIFRIPIKV